MLQIFKPEIVNEIATLHNADLQQAYSQLTSGKVFQTVQADEKKYNQLKTEAAVGLGPVDISSDQQIKAWTQQRDHANSEAQYWTNEQSCQLYGGTNNGLKCQPGYGPVAQNDQANIVYWQGQARTLSDEIQARTTQLEKQGQQGQLAQRQAAELEPPAAKAASQELATQTSNTTSGINGNHGLLEQLKALDIVAGGNSTLQTARILLFLLFLFIDVMPVFVKLLINIAPASTYDLILEDEERMQVRDAENARAMRLAARRQALQAEAAGLRHWYEGLRTPAEGAREELMAVKKRVEKAKLKQFERQQMRDMRAGQGFIGVGLRPGAGTTAWPAPGPAPWPGPGPAPGQPLSGGYRAWQTPPQAGAAPGNGRQPGGPAYPGSNGHREHSAQARWRSWWVRLRTFRLPRPSFTAERSSVPDGQGPGFNGRQPAEQQVPSGNVTVVPPALPWNQPAGRPAAAPEAVWPEHEATPEQDATRPEYANPGYANPDNAGNDAAGQFPDFGEATDPEPLDDELESDLDLG